MKSKKREVSQREEKSKRERDDDLQAVQRYSLYIQEAIHPCEDSEVPITAVLAIGGGLELKRVAHRLFDTWKFFSGTKFWSRVSWCTHGWLTYKTPRSYQFSSCW
jgi:hypothetical protein